MNYKKLSVLLLGIFITGYSFAQTEAQLQRWYQLDYKKDTFYGISLDQAYDFLKNRKPVEVVVGVVDSGIDTAHRELKNILWVNKKEKKGNKKDDDRNGYVDDIHGWNFLGNADGTNVNKEVDEETRLYYQLKDKYLGKTIDSSKLSQAEAHEYEIWKIAYKKFSGYNVAENERILENFKESIEGLNFGDSILRNRLNKEEFSVKDLRAAAIMDMTGFQMKNAYLSFTDQFKLPEEFTNKQLLADFKSEKERLEKEIKNHTVAPPRYRDEIVKDNYRDFQDRYYGNNDLMAEEAEHGTHVSGIIAADRNNNFGIKGIADKARIMTLRAVPDGDEYDKDVALSIIYAVNNGAKVINMSFGKRVSPEKHWVDSAFNYAAQKDVLLVHAAGNDNKNIDSVDNFPNADLKAFGNKRAANLITVGASSDPRVDGGNMVAVFSNYGVKNVDVFAPGYKIYSTLPGKDSLGFQSGTSMASPVVAGIAALIRSYFPKLTALEVKDVIERSVFYPADTVKVNMPGNDEKKVTLKQLSRTGGIVNAYNAVKLAAKLEETKNIN